MICPWDWLRQSPPSFCEETLCGWVKQPANTWSNIGFLVSAALLWRGSTSAPCSWERGC
jgi:hypothetical protein